MDLGRNGRGSGRVVVERILGEMTVRFVLLVNKQGQTRLAMQGDLFPGWAILILQSACAQVQRAHLLELL